MKYSFILLCFSLLFVSCYSFKGISIDPAVKTFSIEPVVDISNQSPSKYPNLFYDGLLNKIKRDTRLLNSSTKPDLHFICKVNRFEVNSQAPIDGSTSAINRLTITLDVECINNNNDKLNWKQTFSRYEDFAANANFLTEQDKLMDNINKLLFEDIFNKAFSNW